MPELTTKKYVDNNGTNCPVCGSDNIEGEEVEVLAGSARQDVYCLECDATWTDVYSLTGYMSLVE